MFIFPTPEGFDTFLDVAMQQSSDIDSGPTDVAAGYLALVYERVTDLPPSMRREAMTHGWRVDSADAYPVVECRDPDRALRPVVERDVEIVTACALSLGAFVLKHAPIFSSDTFTPGASTRNAACLPTRPSTPTDGTPRRYKTRTNDW